MLMVDSTPKTFPFFKVISKELGKNMFHREFESIDAIYTLLPDFAPRPIAWATYETIPDAHFFLCSYHDIKICPIHINPMLFDEPHADCK